MPLLLLFGLFLVVPLLELYVIIELGRAIGLVPTLLVLFLDSVLGAAIARSQGRQAWRRFNEAMSAGRMPGREVVDGALILLGGALLLTPGFITDAVGFALLLPPTRAALRSLLRRAAAGTPQGRPVFFVYDRWSARRDRRADGPAPGADVEGTAREIPDEGPTLTDGEDERA